MTLAGTFKKTPQGITLDGKPAKGAPRMPDENAFMMGPLGPAAEMFLGLPAKTFMYYAFSNEEDMEVYRKGLRDGSAEPLFFKRQTFAMPFDVINEIWRRAPKGLIGVLQVVLYDENDWKDVVYVDMMSVHPKWRRGGINTLMLNDLMLSSSAKGRKLRFSKTTHDGQAFAEWWRAQGREVSVDGEEVRKAPMKFTSTTPRAPRTSGSSASTRVTVKKVDGEWQARVYINGRFDEGKTYFAMDKADAEATAREMRRELGIES